MATKELAQKEAVRQYLVQKDLQGQLADPNSGYSQSIKGALFNILAPQATQRVNADGTCAAGHPAECLSAHHEAPAEGYMQETPVAQTPAVPIDSAAGNT